MSQVRAQLTDQDFCEQSFILLLQTIKENASLPANIKLFASELIKALNDKDPKKMIVMLKAFLTTLVTIKPITNEKKADIAKLGISLLMQTETYFYGSSLAEKNEGLQYLLKLLADCCNALLQEQNKTLFNEKNGRIKIEIIKCHAVQFGEILKLMTLVLKDHHLRMTAKAKQQQLKAALKPPQINGVNNKFILESDEKLLEEYNKIMSSLASYELSRSSFSKDLRIIIEKRVCWMINIINIRTELYTEYQDNNYKKKRSTHCEKMAETINTSIHACEIELKKLSADTYSESTRNTMLYNYGALTANKFNVTPNDGTDTTESKRFLDECFRLINLGKLQYEFITVAFAIKTILPILLIISNYKSSEDLLNEIYNYFKAKPKTEPEIIQYYRNFIKYEIEISLECHDDINAEYRKIFKDIKENFLNSWDMDGKPLLSDPLLKLTILDRTIAHLTDAEKNKITEEKRMASEDKISAIQYTSISLLTAYKAKITDEAHLEKVKIFERYLLSIGQQEGDVFIIQNPIKGHGVPEKHELTFQDLERLFPKSGHPKSIIQSFLKNLYSPKLEYEIYVGDNKNVSDKKPLSLINSDALAIGTKPLPEKEKRNQIEAAASSVLGTDASTQPRMKKTIGKETEQKRIEAEKKEKDNLRKEKERRDKEQRKLVAQQKEARRLQAKEDLKKKNEARQTLLKETQEDFLLREKIPADADLTHLKKSSCR